MTATSVLRLWRLIVVHGRTAALVLLLVGAGGLAGGAWVYTHPPTTEVTESTHVQSVHTDFGTTATATGETPLYRAGERLRNERVYLQRAAPVVSVTLQTDVPEGTKVTVEQRLVLQTLALHEGSVFWRRNRTLAQTRTSTTDGTVVSRARLNVTALRDRLARYRQTISGAGSLAVRLQFAVAYDTGRYQGRFAERVAISLGNGWYSIPPTSIERTRRTTVQRHETVPRSRLTYLLPFFVGAIGLLCALAVTGLRQTRDLDVDELTQRIQRESHDEWISSGRLDDLDGERRVEVDTLADLVDVGIDADRRVIHDADRDVYAVFDDETVYYYVDAPDDWEWPVS